MAFNLNEADCGLQDYHFKYMNIHSLYNQHFQKGILHVDTSPHQILTQTISDMDNFLHRMKTMMTTGGQNQIRTISDAWIYF